MARKWLGVPSSSIPGLRDLEQMAECLSADQETHIEGVQLGRTLDLLDRHVEWATAKVESLKIQEKYKLTRDEIIDLLSTKGLA